MKARREELAERRVTELAEEATLLRVDVPAAGGVVERVPLTFKFPEASRFAPAILPELSLNPAAVPAAGNELPKDEDVPPPPAPTLFTLAALVAASMGIPRTTSDIYSA